MSHSRIASKLSPLYGVARSAGAQFCEVAGWQVPEVYTGAELESAAARRGVSLCDQTARGRLQVLGPAAAAVLAAVYQVTELPAGRGAAAGAYRVYRLRDDLFFLSTSAGDEGAAVREIETAARDRGHFVTVTDMTHGRAEILVLGPTSPDLLRRVCGLDFDPAVFVGGRAAQSSVARTQQLIIRRDLGSVPAFSLMGARSVAAYLWETLMAAGREWGIAPIGRAGLQSLQEQAR